MEAIVKLLFVTLLYLSKYLNNKSISKESGYYIKDFSLNLSSNIIYATPINSELLK